MSDGGINLNEPVQCSDSGGAVNDSRPPNIFRRRENVLTESEMGRVINGDTTLQGAAKGIPFQSRREGTSAASAENPSSNSSDNIVLDEVASSHHLPAERPEKEDDSIKVISCVCTSTLEPGRKDYIANCSTGEKMTQCLGTELGHDVINSTLNMSSRELYHLIDEMGEKQRAVHYKVAILHLFCHGTDQSVKLADGFLNRKDIVQKFQSQFPPDVMKIIIFECCRLENPPTCDSIEEENPDATNSKKVYPLKVHDCSVQHGRYPVSNNTIVIEATDYNKQSFYIEYDGCGLFTKHFTKLAPTQNVSLGELLIQVRNLVYKEAEAEGEDQFLTYKDRLFNTVYLLAESRGKARVPATNVSATTSLLDAQVSWEMDKRVEKRVKEYHAVITLKEGDVLQTKTCQQSPALFCNLPSNKECCVKVETVYTDLMRVSSKPHNFKTPDIKPAVIKSAKLLHLRHDNKVVYKVEISYDESSKEKVREVVINATTQDGDTVKESVNNRFAELSLLPGKTYSVFTDTYYMSVGNKPLRGWDSIEIPTPSDANVKPVLTEDSMEQRAANVSITEPSILQEKQRYFCPDMQLSSIKYTLTEVPRDGNLEQGSHTDYKDFDPPYPTDSSDTFESGTNERKVTKLKPGKKYLMKVKAECKTVDNTYSTIESDGILVTTKPYTGFQKCGYSCGALTVYLVLLFNFLLSFAGIAAFAAYNIKLAHSEHCSMQNIITNGRIECGRADTFYYHEIEDKGLTDKGDSLLRSINASSVREADMVFDTKVHKPRTDGGIIIIPLRHLLLGWDIYTWIGSVIYGYCCITNNADITQTATLHMFINDYDAISYMNGSDAQNAILSETIHIPRPGPTSELACFKTWGSEAPYTVTHNAYHYIVVEFPTQTNFTSKITVSQKVPNKSNFGSPHSFLYSDSTKFTLPTWPLFSHDIYVIVCDAPTTDARNELNTNVSVLEPNTTLLQTIPSSLGQESVHIQSCNLPYHWMAIVFPIMLAVSLLLLVCSTSWCVVMTVCIHKYHKDKLCTPWKFQPRQRRHGDGPRYTIQQNQNQ